MEPCALALEPADGRRRVRGRVDGNGDASPALAVEPVASSPAAKTSPAPRSRLFEPEPPWPPWARRPRAAWPLAVRAASTARAVPRA